MKCNCKEIKASLIKSDDQLTKYLTFFDNNISQNIFKEIPVTAPSAVSTDCHGGITEWFADKWYLCQKCETLWEIEYPDFPKWGEVKKFEDGVRGEPDELF